MNFVKGLAGDLTGANEVGKVIPRANFGSEDSLKMFVPVNETPLLYVKSGIKEFIFTDFALIVIRKNSSTSTKRSVIHLAYATELVSDVSITTPGFGMTDLDLELCFRMGSLSFQEGENNSEIDLWKSELDRAMKVYHAVNAIADEQKKRATMLQVISGSENITLTSSKEIVDQIYGTYKDVISPFVV